MIFRDAAGITGHDDVVSRFERRSGQAALGELLRCSAFDHPDLLLAFLIGGFHLDEGVRVAPDELLHRAFNFDDLAVDVGGRRRMMRKSRRRKDESETDNEQSRSHANRS